MGKCHPCPNSPCKVKGSVWLGWLHVPLRLKAIGTMAIGGGCMGCHSDQSAHAHVAMYLRFFTEVVRCLAPLTFIHPSTKPHGTRNGLLDHV